MNSREPIILGILIFITIFLAWVLFSQLNERRVLAEDEYRETYIESQVEYGFPIEESRYDDNLYLPLEICHDYFCYTIGKDSIKSFYNGSQLNRRELYMYLLENVVTYFEKLSGGKTKIENRSGSFYIWENDYIFDTSNIYTDVEDILLNRFEKNYIWKIEIDKKDIPGTTGTYADKYIEVDYSKQKLYVWLDHELVKTILLSGAKNDFEVYGVFPIVDKGIQPIAPGEKYMPYWMAFYYSPSQDSWYGLHALIWWYDDSGNKIFESVGNIGIRRSRGCIRMLLEDAKFLYDNFDKGDPILIHP